VIGSLAADVGAPIMRDRTQWLVVTSRFACTLGLRNSVTRYRSALGRRSVLRATLGKTHPVHRTPSRASLCVSALPAAVVLDSALAQLDPVVEMYSWYSGLGAVGVILMMALTSIAVLGWGMRPGAGRGAGRAGGGVLAATALGGLGLLLVLGLSVANLPLM